MDINVAPIHLSNSALLNDILAELSHRFNCQVNLIELEINIESAFSIERKQFFSTQLLANAINLSGNINGKILLLTEFDLFVPALTFVFGEAQLNGKHSIVSLCRLHEEFYSGTSNYKILLERALKEILHELGHNYGLKHCQNWDCVMHASLSIEEVDIKGDKYCKTCAASVEGYKIL
ncbi:MAG: archaemetzincin family Zn-dependent metalloprotease [Ignavibacteriaceae bacterium]|jgi:archaemetzincin